MHSDCHADRYRHTNNDGDSFENAYVDTIAHRDADQHADFNLNSLCGTDGYKYPNRDAHD